MTISNKTFLQHLQTLSQASQTQPGSQLNEGNYPEISKKVPVPDAISQGKGVKGKYPEPTAKQRKPNLMGEKTTDEVMEMEEADLVTLIDNDADLCAKSDSLDENDIKELLASDKDEDRLLAIGTLLRLERDLELVNELSNMNETEVDALTEEEELAEIEAELNEMSDEELDALEARLDEEDDGN